MGWCKASSWAKINKPICFCLNDKYDASYDAPQTRVGAYIHIYISMKILWVIWIRTIWSTSNWGYDFRPFKRTALLISYWRVTIQGVCVTNKLNFEYIYIYVNNIVYIVIKKIKYSNKNLKINILLSRLVISN